MDPKRWQRIQDLFEAASTRDVAGREEFLSRECGGDAQLRKEVDDLLAASAEDGDAIHDAIASAPALTVEAMTLAVGSEMGPYKILERIGEGGMGEVFVADQRSPIERRVALKIVKIGMNTREVLNRFNAERQTLARMEHPGIADVYDAGVAPHGQPFFTMEYVPGKPITDYVRDRRLDLQACVHLFIDLCDAVQHAHQKGVIHRDLKPSNILVTERNDKPVIKVIDFGIAKAIAGKLTDETMFTSHGLVIGTPEYMSPEQAATDSTDVDTRSDVYSLGVILYELLVGELPFERQQYRGSLAQAQRLIRDEDPPRPSTRLGTTSTPGNARSRGALQGDLDAITMKALAKQRRDRYSGAAELAADLRRYLDDEPVLARPASALVRFRKYARRHRVVVGAAAAVVIVLCAATVFSVRWAQVAIDAGEVAKAKEAEAKRQSDFALLLATQSVMQSAQRNVAIDMLDRVPQPDNWVWRHLSSQLDGCTTHIDADEDVLEVGFADDAEVGPTVITVHQSGRISWWDSERGTLRRQSTLGDSGLTTASLSGNGRRVATISEQPLGVAIWSTEDGSLLHRYPATKPPARLVALDFDGDRLTTVVDKSRVGYRASWTADPVVVDYPELRHVVGRVAYTGDDKAVFLAPGYQQLLVDPQTGETLFTADVGGPSAAPFDSSKMAVMLRTGVTAYDVASGEKEHLAPGGFLRTPGSALARDRILGVKNGCVVDHYHLDNSERHRHFSCRPALPGSLQLDRRGERALYLSADRRRVCVWDTTAEDLTKLQHGWFTYRGLFSPDGARIYSVSWDGKLYLWDAVSRDLIARRPSADGHGLVGLAMHPNGTRLATSDTEGSVEVFDVQSGRTVATWVDSQRRHTQIWLEWSPTGEHLVGTSRYGEVWVWNPTSCEVLFEIDLPDGPQRQIAFSPDGSTAILRSHLLDMHALELRKVWSRGTYGVAWSPDGGQVALGKRGKIELWDTTSWEQTGELVTNDTLVYGLRYSPDGSQLVSGDAAGAIFVWDLELKQAVLHWNRHAEYVYSLSYSPDGSILASASGDSTVRLWEVTPIRDRISARAAMRAAREEVTPHVEQLFRNFGDVDTLFEALRADATLEGLRLEAALQVATRLAWGQE
ncbi:MAG: serine/threonine-protein kinase [Planctomycetota bacterium]